MATYQSVSSVGIDSVGTTVVIPKPSGLSVGDLMVAGVRSFRNSADTAITPPAGWTTQETNLIFSGSSPCQRLSVFTKLADSADVAASNFTFTVDTSTDWGGIMIRVSNPGLQNAGETGGTIRTSASTSTTITGFTPSRANCLLVFFAARGERVTGTADITSVSLATNNPTWTRRAQVVRNGLNDSNAFACFTATRPETTATGTITYNFSAGSNPFTNGIMLAISARVDGSVTPTQKVNAYALTPIQSAQLEAITEDPTYRTGKQTAWQNESKPSTNWQNETL